MTNHESMIFSKETWADDTRNGYGVSALVLGILGALAGLIPLAGMLVGGPLGVIGLVLGLLGRARVRRGQATNRRQALWGIWLSGLAIVLGVVGLVIVMKALNDFNHDVQDIQRNLDQPTQ